VKAPDMTLKVENRSYVEAYLDGLCSGLGYVTAFALAGLVALWVMT
jgi:Na+-transporting NADH:ubiquinone oxidoreductase subunit NqrD